MDMPVILGSNNVSFQSHNDDVITISGVISGAFGVTTSGIGTFVFSGNNTYTGTTTVQEGTLLLRGNMYNSGTIAASIVVNNGATLLTDKQDIFGVHTTTPLVSITINDGGIVSSTNYFNTLNNLVVNGGQLQSNGGNNPWESFALKGTVATSGATQSIISSPSGTFNKVKIGSNSAGGSTTFNVGDGVVGDDLLISSQLENNKDGGGNFVASRFIKTGAGTVNLTASNEFSGGYTHTNGDTKVSNNTSLGTGTAVMNGSGRFLLQNGLNVANALTVTSSSPGVGFGTITLESGTATWSGNIGVNASTGNGGHFASDGTELIISGTITGASGVVVTHRRGNITYSGGGTASRFYLLEGNAKLAANNGLPSNTVFQQNHPTFTTSLDLFNFDQAFSGLEAATTNQTITNSQATIKTLLLNGAQGSSLTYRGAITGRIKLELTGTTTQTLTGTNTYTGTTVIAAGCTLRVGAGGTVGSITGNVVNNGTLIFDRSNAYTFGGVISGTGTVIKEGSGTLTLTGANSYTGATLINAGTITLGASGVIPDLSAVVITGTLNMNGFNETVGSISGTGTINNLSGTGTYTLTAGGNNTTVTYSGVIQNSIGSVSFVKVGTGVQTLSGVNTYGGSTTVNAGTLRAGSGSALGATNSGTQINSNAIFDINGQQLGAEEFVLNGGTMVNNGIAQVNAVQKVRVIANSFIGGINRWDVRNFSPADGYVTVNSPFTLTKQDANTIIFVRGTITNNGNIIINNGVLSLQTNPTFAGTGNYTVNSAGILNLISFGGPTVLTNNVTVNNGAIIGSTDNTGGNSSISGTVTLSGSSTINNTVDFGISGVIAGSGNYTKTGIGTLTVSGNNTYSGTTTVNTGVLRLNSSTALGAIAGTTTVSAGASLDLNGVNYSLAEPITINGGGYSSTGVILNSNTTAATYAGPITMAGNSTLTAPNAYTLSGNISGSSFNLVKSGTNALTFTSNTVSVNDFTISTGTVNAGNSTININNAFVITSTFNENTGEVAFVGVSPQTVPNHSFYNLRVNNAAGVSLAANTSIAGTVFMTNGILSTGAFAINLGSVGNLNETTPTAQAPTSYITGTVTTTRNMIQSVPNSFGGIGLVLTENNIASNSTVVRRVTGTVSSIPSGESSIARYFEIVPTIDTGLDATMEFNYFDHEITGHLEDSLVVYKSSDNRATWDGFRPTALSLATNTVTLSGIEDFSFWTLSDVESEPLPITLLNFNVKASADNYVAISWTTIKEENNAYFTIEKSVDGVNWAFVKEVRGAGTTNQKIAYIEIDKKPFQGISYYRLKQTDFDGKFEYFKIVPVELNYVAIKSFECNIYPSPSRVDNINMLMSSEELGVYNINIANGIGNVLYSTQIDHQEKSEFVDLSNSISDYNFGTYYITVKNSKNSTCRQKIIFE